MAPTLTCTGPRGVAATVSQAKTQDRFIAGMPAWHPRSHAPGWGGVATTGTGEESAHAVTGLGPGRPLCADDSFASGKEGVAARRAPRFTEIRDDCPDQYHAEGSL